MKKILKIKEVEPGILRIKLEATKRRTIWIKLLGEETKNGYCCNFCPLIRTSCAYIPSPLINYNNWNDFCNYLLISYPELKQRLRVGWGIEYSSQFVVYNEKSARNKRS